MDVLWQVLWQGTLPLTVRSNIAVEVESWTGKDRNALSPRNEANIWSRLGQTGHSLTD